MATGLGADQCGIANVERFDKAPAGFHPRDIDGQCRSVVVFLKKMPAGVLYVGNPVVYTHTANMYYGMLDRIGLALCLALEKEGIRAMPVPTDVPYHHWEADRMHGMGILSMRHAAFNAGLGILGRNTLLINREAGNQAYIGAILAGTAFEPDPIETGLACPANCNLCLDACPVEALDGITVNQERCRKYSILAHPRGWDLYTCSACRQACMFNTLDT